MSIESIRNASSLVDLCNTLNELWVDESIDHGNIDTGRLPTFGGDEPRITVGIYSWDEDYILVSAADASDKWREDGAAWAVVPRDEF